ncbi:MAG: DUF4301 family protein [Deltaproteobacteria bacterium]|nr:DUF4301 family protein [Deltaproteobacteria bacterium]MBW1736632.1 DUF4301 family protein [Deltaproteobacteria bacterium]MBW1908853.1 DUF4301 family protein [Deltaproteobacteria bacterium]MBW2033158.1 DUF4301 family protein [Deltaproteobacteria bacterium]MBW2114195.1 DUF4301 family protein [Deltaproteobacteria bacterium]
MGQDNFTEQDLRQIRDHGLSVDEVQRQIDLFKMPPPYLKLMGACTPGKGIKVIPREEIQGLIITYEVEAMKGRCLKFVPASGAASRMFKTLFQYLNQDKEVTKELVVRQAQEGRADAQAFLEFMNGTNRFAFFKDLKSVMSEKGLDINELLETGQFTDIIRYLLSESGLNYAGLPKALIKFHAYEHEIRTAFEEHLVEATSYVVNQNGQCVLHFTVSREHLEAFEALLKQVRPYYQQKYGAIFDVTFSVQKRSTDTIAVDLNNRPFRKNNGQLLFRPGGHGALIENLNDLTGDIIFIKNIDNVVPDRLKPETFVWKKVLGGYLVVLQKKVFNYMEKLLSGIVEESSLEHVAAFVRDDLCVDIPVSIENASLEVKRSFLMEKLNRPIRVCGMVKNVGEPGGGPFWVKDIGDEISLQIVETAQVDPDSNEQQTILGSSTHFNPVDLVCGVRDWQGKPFDLRKYVDQNAVFISQKSKDGKELKALEHPGLWNGAMGRWITVFVEVPAITFNPVKTVNDLLRKEHQPG